MRSTVFAATFLFFALLCVPAVLRAQDDCIPFSGCGTLVRGVECVLFQADLGGLYLLSNRGPFSVGDRVFVTGCLELFCLSLCQQGNSCIRNNTIVACVDDQPDFDGDRVADRNDNCSEAANPAQDDTDLDDCGNLCDADYGQSGVVSSGDFGAFIGAFGTNDQQKQHTPPIDATTLVSTGDWGFFIANFGKVPGPSGTTAGTIACP